MLDKILYVVDKYDMPLITTTSIEYVTPPLYNPQILKVKVSHNRPRWPKGFRVG